MFAKPSPSLSLTLTSHTLNFSKTRVAFSGERAAPHGPPPLLSTAPHPVYLPPGDVEVRSEAFQSLRRGFGVCLRRRGVVAAQWKVSWVEMGCFWIFGFCCCFPFPSLCGVFPLPLWSAFLLDFMCAYFMVWTVFLVGSSTTSSLTGPMPDLVVDVLSQYVSLNLLVHVLVSKFW